MTTVILTGRALELARDLKREIDQTNGRLKVLNDESVAIQKAGVERCNKIRADLAKELGIAPDRHCHLDLEYLEEHGLAFAKTGCEEEGMQVADIFREVGGGGLLN